MIKLIFEVIYMAREEKVFTLRVCGKIKIFPANSWERFQTRLCAIPHTTSFSHTFGRMWKNLKKLSFFGFFHILLRIKNELFERIKKEAENNKRSITKHIEYILEKSLEK